MMTIPFCGTVWHSLQLMRKAALALPPNANIAPSAVVTMRASRTIRPLKAIFAIMIFGLGFNRQMECLHGNQVGTFGANNRCLGHAHL